MYLSTLFHFLVLRGAIKTNVPKSVPGGQEYSKSTPFPELCAFSHWNLFLFLLGSCDEGINLRFNGLGHWWDSLLPYLYDGVLRNPLIGHSIHSTFLFQLAELGWPLALEYQSNIESIWLFHDLHLVCVGIIMNMMVPSPRSGNWELIIPIANKINSNSRLLRTHILIHNVTKWIGGSINEPK